MPENIDIPNKLRDLLDAFASMADRSERIATLIELADEFAPAPALIAKPPYPDSALAPYCESQAYVFAHDEADGTLKFYFAVENPQGVSAKAMAVIIDQTMSKAPLDQVLAVNTDVIYEIFGSELSMGKSAGLMGMMQLVHTLAKERLARLARAIGSEESVL